jgi:RNA 2',3'-cyclic 3'-phosphodiesterase
MPETVWRMFIAALLPPELAAHVARTQRHLLHQSGAQFIRWTRPEQVHLTLEFLGNVEVPRVGELCECVRAACAGQTPLRVTLGGLGCFPSLKKPNVLWLGLNGEVAALGRLQAAIRSGTAGFGDHRENRQFQAHLTFGRIKSGAFRQAHHVAQMIEQNPVAELGAWTIDRVVIMRSELLQNGAAHTEVAGIVLQ